MDTSFGENMVVIYLAVFGCLGIFKLFLDVNSLEIRSNVYWGFVSVAFFIYLLSWNISLVTHKIACNDPNGYVAIYSTIMPFAFIFILGGSIINLFPGWLRSFSNTFGLTFVQLCGYTLYDPDNKSDESIIVPDLTITGPEIKTAVEKFYNDPDVLINEMQIDNDEYQKNKEQINKILEPIGCQLNNNNDGYNSLVKYIKIKETVGYAIWFLLLGLLTILTSQNSILSEECNKNVSDDKTFKKYISSELRE